MGAGFVGDGGWICRVQHGIIELQSPTACPYRFSHWGAGIRTAYLEVIESYEFALRHLDQRQYSTTSLNQGPKCVTRGYLGRFRLMGGCVHRICRAGFVGQIQFLFNLNVKSKSKSKYGLCVHVSLNTPPGGTPSPEIFFQTPSPLCVCWPADYYTNTYLDLDLDQAHCQTRISGRNGVLALPYTLFF